MGDGAADDRCDVSSKVERGRGGLFHDFLICEKHNFSRCIIEGEWEREC